jgi:hypothetical protein
MPTAQLSHSPGRRQSPRPLRPVATNTERNLRRRLAQAEAALQASRRDNEQLRRTVDRLLGELGRRPRRSGGWSDAAERRRRMRQVLDEPWSRNP